MTDPSVLDLVVQTLGRIETKVDTLSETVAQRATRDELRAVDQRVTDLDQRQTQFQSESMGRARFLKQVWVACSASAALGMVAIALSQLH